MIQITQTSHVLLLTTTLASRSQGNVHFMRPCILCVNTVRSTKADSHPAGAHLALDFWILEDAAVLLRDCSTTWATSLRIWLRKLAAACEMGFTSTVPSPSQRGVAGVGP